MRRLVDEAYEHCHATLTRNRALLDAVTDSLVEKETLGADEIEVRPRRRPRCISAAGDLGRSREAVCSISALSLRVPSTLLARLCGWDTLSLPTRAAPLAAPTDSGRTACRRRRRGRSRAGASQCASGPREEGRRRAPSMASSGVWQGMGGCILLWSSPVPCRTRQAPGCFPSQRPSWDLARSRSVRRAGLFVCRVLTPLLAASKVPTTTSKNASPQCSILSDIRASSLLHKLETTAECSLHRRPLLAASSA